MKLTAAQVAGEVIRQGGRGDGVVTAVAIVGRETGGTFDTRAFRPASRNPAGGNDRGGWQFNDKYHPDVSDADAYDFKRATAHAARKSAGFTDFGVWDIGPNAYSGRDKLPELMASRHWSVARVAAANPDMRPLPADAGGSSAATMTPGETAFLREWDYDGDGKLTTPDVEARAAALGLGEWPYGVPMAHQVDILRAVDDSIRDGALQSGWLAEVKDSVGLAASSSLTPGYRAVTAQAIASGGISGGIDGFDIGGLIGTVQDAAGILPNPLEPLAAIAAAVTKLIGILTSAEWWRRIGIAVLGGLMIAGAIALTVGQATPVGAVAKGLRSQS